MNRAIAAISAVPIGLRWLLTAAFVALTVVLSVTPAQTKPDDTVFHWLVTNTSTWLQNILHVLFYATLTAMFVWSMEGLASRRLRMILALVCAVAIGAVLEWYQLRVPGRFGNLGDVLLNAGGAVLGIIAAIFLL
jgi:VanZ family protein